MDTLGAWGTRRVSAWLIPTVSPHDGGESFIHSTSSFSVCVSLSSTNSLSCVVVIIYQTCCCWRRFLVAGRVLVFETRSDSPLFASNDDTSSHPRLRHQQSRYSTPIREIGFVVDCETPSIHPTPFIQLLPSLPWPQLRASRSPSLVTRVSNCSRARRTGRMVMLSSSRSLLCRSKFVSNSHLIQLRLEYEANSYTLHR
jgi:hypothetical protein